MTHRRLTPKQLILAGLCGFGWAAAGAVVAPLSSLAQSVETPPVAQESGSMQAPSTTAQPSATPQPSTIQEPGAAQQLSPVQQPGAIQQPNTQPGLIQQPGTVQQPTTGEPSTVQQPDAQQTPGAVQTPDTAQEPGTIIEVAGNNGSFKTLVMAAQSAGLAETLAGEGPFTVFAPTDEAFAALPTEIVNALMLPENQDLLTQVLTYHVVPGEVTSSDLTTGGVETLNGGLAVRVEPNQVVVNNASVIMADVPASNGVIHAINRVLIPTGLVEELQSRMATSNTTEQAPGL